MGKTKIEWCDEVLNPVIGCPRGCEYCYARKMNIRFKWIPDFSKQQYFPEKFDDLFKIKKPSKIFVGSISDICYWKREWILDTIDFCKTYKEHELMFLTKSPWIYNNFKWPKNCTLGLTLTGTEKYLNHKGLVGDLIRNPNKKFISIEPILGPIWNVEQIFIDQVFVGPKTNPENIKPKPEWIESVRHNFPEEKILWKEKMLKYL